VSEGVDGSVRFNGFQFGFAGKHQLRILALNPGLQSNSVDKFSEDDYFVEDRKQYFTKADLKQMLERDEIATTMRNYGNEEGFTGLHI
jgi:hypothetical protein